MTLATCANDVKFYQWPDLSTIGVYEAPHSTTLKSISWCCKGNEILVTRSNGKPMIVKAPPDKNQPSSPIHPYNCININDPIIATYSNTNPNLAALAFESGRVVGYNVKTKKVVHDVQAKFPNFIQSLEFSPNDWNVAIGSKAGKIFLLNIKWKPCASFSLPNNSGLSTMSFGRKHSNYLLAAASRDGYVSLWNTATVRNLYSEKKHNGLVTDVTFLGEVLASVGTDGKFCGCDLRNFQTTHCYELKCPLTGIGFLPDSCYVAISTVSGYLKCYDIRNMKSPLKAVIVGTQAVKKIAFSNTKMDAAGDFAQAGQSKSKTNKTCNINNHELCAGDFRGRTGSNVDCTQEKRNSIVKSEPIVKIIAAPRRPTIGFEEFKSLMGADVEASNKLYRGKIHDLSYNERLNMSKRFISIDEKMSTSWNNFLKYLKMSGRNAAASTESQSKISTLPTLPTTKIPSNSSTEATAQETIVSTS